MNVLGALSNTALAPPDHVVALDPYEWHIVIADSQSNADLRADIDSLSVANADHYVFLDQSFSPVQFTRHAAPVTVDPPVFADTSGTLALGSDASNNMGVELTLGRRLSEALKGKVFLHFWSVDGSSVDQNRDMNVAFPTVGPNLHSLMLTHLHSVCPKMDAFITIDGESDAIAPAVPGNYQSKKTANLNDIRSSFAGLTPMTPCPIVMSQLADTHSYTNQTTIIAAQASIAGAMSNFTLVSNSGRVLNGINHYTNKSFADLGNDLADAVLARLGFPRVRWTSAVTGGSGRQITFTYTGTGAAATSWFWDFGDGSTSTSQNPVHTYAANGKYTVKCTATSASGRRNSFTRPRVAVNPSGRWTVDATSGKARPANQTEANNLASDAGLLIGAANHLYQLQEASGNPADTGTGGKTLTAGNTPAYQQTVGGWSTKFVSGTGAASTQSFVSATMTNDNAARVAGMSYINWASSAVVSNRSLINRGGPSISEVTSSGASAKTRLVYGSNSALSVNDHAGSTIPHFVYQDPTAQRVIFASPLEVFELNFFRQTGTAYAQQTGTEFRITTQASADATKQSQHNFAMAWDGIGQTFADSLTINTGAGPNYDELRCMFEAHGFDCSW